MEKKDFIDVIKLRLLRWGDCPGLSVWALNTTHVSLLMERSKTWHREEEKAAWSLRQRSKWYGHKPRDTSSHPTKNCKREGRILRTSGGITTLSLCWSQPSNTSFRPLASRSMGESISVEVSHQVCSFCYSSYRKQIFTLMDIQIISNLLLYKSCCSKFPWTYVISHMSE